MAATLLPADTLTPPRQDAAVAAAPLAALLASIRRQATRWIWVESLALALLAALAAAWLSLALDWLVEPPADGLRCTVKLRARDSQHPALVRVSGGAAAGSAS